VRGLVFNEAECTARCGRVRGDQHTASGFRRNHAKGICVSGYFDSNGAGEPLSHASVFARGRYPVIGRLSMPGGDPGQNDNEGMVRSFALRIALPRGAEWRLAMNSVNSFAMRTPQALFDQLKASERDPQTRHVDHAKMQAFLVGHPELQGFRQYLDQHPPSSPYGNATYYGISAFQTTDAQGVHRFVRWDVVPENSYRPVDLSEQRAPDSLAYDLMMQLAKRPLRWHLMLNVAITGDTIDDSTRQWKKSRSRPRIDTGTFVIDHAQAQIDGPCRDVVFDPVILRTALRHHPIRCLRHARPRTACRSIGDCGRKRRPV
jgi:catalase